MQNNIHEKLFLKKNYIFLLFLILPISLWCLKELTNFGTDFGGYYSGAYFLSEDYSLYRDHFDHKGPAYYLFIKIISTFIGWGIIQSLFILFLSIMVFFIPIIYIIKNHCRTIFSKASMVLLAVSILYGQDSNSSISFFQEGLLISGFIPLLEKRYKIKYLLLANIFFSLAFFTRIDSIIFLPIFLIYSLRVARKNNSLVKKFIALGSSFAIIFLIFVFLANLFNFSFQDFYVSNFTFNKWYKENLKKF